MGSSEFSIFNQFPNFQISMTKTILHVDMNSYFATVEQQANPYLRGRPVGVIKAEGRGCIIAASVEAKKFGVKTGCTVWDAKKLCPRIILVPSDMDKYFALTQKLVKMVSDYSPAVEVFSIDECFLDITQSQNLFAGGFLQMALEIKMRIKQELGEWMKASIGISFTKLLAKLASEMRKPDGLMFLTPENYLQETQKVLVEDVCGIGRARTTTLQSMGVRTLGEARMRSLPREVEDLVWLRVEEPVVTVDDLRPAKSVSRTYTTFAILNTQCSILRLVRNLVEEAVAKLREMGMTGRTFYLTLNPSPNFSQVRGFTVGEGHYVKTLKYPTNDPQIIFDLLAGEYKKNPVEGVRRAGVWITNLMFNVQCSMFNGREKLLKAVDEVNRKFGLFTVYPVCLLGGELVRPEVTGFLGDKYYRLTDRQD